MPATIYAPPAGLEAPSIEEQMRLDFKIAPPDGRPHKERRSEYDKAHDAYIDKLSAAARAQYPNPDPLIGEVLRFGAGDGYAEYVVWDTRPLSLIHVAWGDSWHMSELERRGLNLTYARKLAAAERATSRLFGGG